MMYVKLWSEGYKCTKKGIFCRTESVAMTPKSCAHMRSTSLWGVAAKLRASSSAEAEADTLPERPTRIQPYQFESVRQDFESTRTACQQQNCQNWKYGLVSKPFCSPQMIVYRSACCIAMSRLKCPVWSILFLFFHSATSSNMTDPWQNFSEAEFHIFLCTTIEIIIYCFQGCE